MNLFFPDRQRFLSLVLLLVGFGTPASAAIDLNGDGIGDIWALQYESQGLDPAADLDGDGMTNGQENAAGTDPRSPQSTIAISKVALDGAAGPGVHLTWMTVSGKGYRVESSPTLVRPSWQNELPDEVIPGMGEEITRTFATAGATRKYYRVVVQDMDTDGDGVSDWEELAVGFDRANDHTAGLGKSDDLAAITTALQAVNTVKVVATDSAAAEAGSDVGTFMITRAGNLNPITVRYGMSGTATPGVDYETLSGSVALGLGVNSAALVVTPKNDAVRESPEAAILTITPDAAYTVGSPAMATVLLNDEVQANGSGLNAAYYNFPGTNGADTPPAAIPATPSRVRIDPIVNFTWATNTSPTGSVAPDNTATATTIGHDYFISRWTGEVLPEFSQIYTFYIDVNRGGRLWVGDMEVPLINKWPSGGSGKFSAPLPLEGGRRYPVIFEHYETTGDAKAVLSWKSANTFDTNTSGTAIDQVLPQSRLFPNAAPQITSATEVLLLKDSGAYSYQIRASGSPLGFSAANLPPGWTFNAITGVISGAPTVVGTWEIPLTATNANGSGSAILQLSVIATGGGITRDVWQLFTGAIGDIPPRDASPERNEVPPTSSGLISSLDAAQSSPDGGDFAARIRGYITAPRTGVFKFFVTGDDAAELWISDDEEPANSFKRAEVTSATGYREWQHASAGRSPLLWLEAGRRYYIEVRHKESASLDHVSVGWLKPGEGGIDPMSVVIPPEIVPGYALSPFTTASPDAGGGTLFSTVLTAQSAAATGGYGSGSLRLSVDETVAILSYTFANLGSPVTGAHIHSASHGGAIIFDIDDAPRNPDGSYTWHLEAAGAVSAAEVLNVLKGGAAYLNIHTANYPAGEIKGFFRQQSASQTFTPPPAAPGWANDASDANAAARFLVQSTFGVSGADANANGTPDAIEQVQALGYEGWIDEQLGLAASDHYPYVFANRNQTNPMNSTYSGTLTFSSWWRNSVTAPDQLRQRVAFALSQILVVSEAGPLDDRADALSDYYDTLLEHAFGNFRNLLEAVTLHPAMGRYLDMLRNDKPDKTTGRIPNENYAREILQLFSVGLNRMWPDGSLMLNSKGELIPTYDQSAIIGFAHAFSGWDYYYTGGFRTSFGAGSNWINPMREVPNRHFTGQKRLLNNVVLPGLPLVAGEPIDPYAAHSAAQYNDPAYQALPPQELDATHDAIFNHPNTGPFICRQLIQRLITSTPSRGYIYRVVERFNNDGSPGGVRGNLGAVIKAILLDYEARSPQSLTQQGFGKQREPVIRVTGVARGFPAPPPVAGTYAQGQSGDPLNIIRLTTNAAHLYANNNSAFLDFSNGVPSDPDDTAYPVTVVNTTQFTVRPLATEAVTGYSQTGSVITMTTNGHTFDASNSVYIDFVTGSPSTPADGLYTVASVTGDDLVFTVRPLSSINASYNQTADTITVTTTGHAFAVGSSVHLNFTSGAPSPPVDAIFTVISVSADGLQFTVTGGDLVDRTGNLVATPASDAVNRTGSNNSAYATRAAYAVARTGTVAVNYSDWNLGSTETALNQTPLRAPTVFNFYEPDYQYPGALAENGLVTPEFQLTSETSVIRQANFLYDGLFNDALAQSGLSSFQSGGRDIFVDLRPWMGAGPGGLPWVHNTNMDAFITKLNTLLMGGQLPLPARTVIKNYAQTLPYTTPSTGQLRDRARAVVHLIVTSPDFTIQK